MKHVTIADKSLLAGDEVVDLLIEYATVLGQHGSADSVELHAIGADGDDVLVTFLLNSGISIVAESTRSSVPEPDNSRTESHLHAQIARLRGMDTGTAEDVAGSAVWNGPYGA